MIIRDRHWLCASIVAFATNLACEALPETDAGGAGLSDEAELRAACIEPEIFGESTLSTSADEGRIVFANRGRIAYFHRVDETGHLKIMVARRHYNTWSEVHVAAFSNTGFNDLDPFVSDDGRWLYFASDRPVSGDEAQADWDLWRVRRLGFDRWGEPERLDTAVNQASNELYPTLARDGVLYFNSDREDGYGGWDIWRASRNRHGFEPAQNLGPGVNTEAWEFNPTLDKRERTLLFASMFRPAHADPDLYVSWQRHGEWQQGERLDACINTPSPEFHPTLTDDGQLYFVRADEFGGDFYTTEWDGRSGSCETSVAELQPD
jgi:hypothetical protein